MNGLPQYKIKSVPDSRIDELGQFEVIMEEANKKGLVNEVPKNEAEAYDIDRQKIRLQTIATRLYLLGYLRNKIPSRRIHKKLENIKEAVLKFQKDANLVQDNWVGDETWFALDELVSFESDFSEDKWFVEGEIRPEVINAIHRATQLRLWCLGLYRRKPKPNFKLLSKVSLYKYGRILKIFLIKSNAFATNFNYESLSILFDQDLLTQAITKRSKPNKDSFFIKLAKGKKKAERELSQSFMVNCAKIELWLLGYDVKIDGDTSFQYEEGGDLWAGISSYYQQFRGMNKRDAGALAMKITPKFFLEIGSALDAASTYNLDDASEEIVNELYSSNEVTTTNNINEAWNYIKEKGIRLWDGLKRIWRWIKKIGKNAARFIKNNVFKAFYRYTSKTYKIFTRGLSAVLKSFAVYFKGYLNSPGMFFGFSKDLDFISFISKSVSVENANLGISKLVKQSKAFNLGCRIVGFLFYIFKNLALGLLGWAKILFSLLKGYKELKLLYADLKMIA